MPNLWLIFTTGLIAGGLTCAAVQGGLLATTIAGLRGEEKKSPLLPTLSFLIAKLFIYSVLGLFLGWVGKAVTFSLTIQAVFLTVVTVFMIGTALAMLDVHPIFRYFMIQPPKFLTRLVRTQTKSHSMFAPAFLGLFTIVIPCGTTQAMMAVALATRNPFYGAFVMGTFVLGTFPIFLLLGYGVTFLKSLFESKFSLVAAYVILGLAFFNIRAIIIQTGWDTKVSKISQSVVCTVTFCSDSWIVGETKSDVTIHVKSHGYESDAKALKAGQNVTLTLVNDDSYTCAQAFTIPSLKLQTVIPVGEKKTLSFIVPTGVKQLAYTCSMGMYRGEWNVVP